MRVNRKESQRVEQWADAERSWWEQSVGGQRRHWQHQQSHDGGALAPARGNWAGHVTEKFDESSGHGGRDSDQRVQARRNRVRGGGSGVVCLHTIERKPFCGLD